MNTSDLSISLMGIFALRIKGARQNLHLCGNTKNLLMLLACHNNHALRKDYVIDQVWPHAEPEKARSALNTAIWRIKKGLANYHDIDIQSHDDIIKLHLGPEIHIDVRAVETSIDLASTTKIDNNTLTCENRERLLEAVSSCQGSFLEGCDDHWVLAPREQYATLYIQALCLIMRDAGELGQYETALKYGREILNYDPLREVTQREVMWLYVLNGQRAQALRQYDDLKNTLQRELNIAPMPETTAIYMHVLKSDSIQNQSETVAKMTSDEKTLPELSTLENARRDVLRVLSMASA